MTRIFFIAGLWLAGLLSGQHGGSDRGTIVKSDVTRLTPDKDSVLIRAGPLNRTASYQFPLKVPDFSGK